MIKIRNLRKAFGRQTVLDDCNLSFDRKGITAILGPNGSGKTTMVKCIIGLVTPQKGQIDFQGKSLLNQWQYRSDISYLPQIGRFPENSSVLEIIQLIKSIRPGATRDEMLIELFDLKPHLKKKLKELSGGFRQKLNITLSLMYDCPVVILDEPSTGLDPLALVRFKDFIRKEEESGKTILLITHIMSLVDELADKIVFMLDGKIAFYGKVSELLAQENENNVEKAIADLLAKGKI